MNRQHLISGLGFGIAMGCFFIIQNLWGMETYSTSTILKSVVSGIIAGTVSGLLFGWITRLLGKQLKRGHQIEFLDTGETVIFETPANHFKGIEAVGGQLYLTNKRLIFQSHSFNVQNHRLIIDTHSIAEVKKSRTLGIISNGLVVKTDDGRNEKFVVHSVNKWIQELNGNVAAANLL